MTNNAGPFLRTGFTLVLCVLLVALPGLAGMPMDCACGEVDGAVEGECIVQTANVSPCCAQKVEVQSSCCSTPPLQRAATCCGGEPDSGPLDGGSKPQPCDSPCCLEDGPEEFPVPPGFATSFEGDDHGAPMVFGAVVARIAPEFEDGAFHEQSTGPPRGHRLRRMLLERSSTVLLI
ncbi:MAG: hypothetical protein AAF196_00325 [Planctomycetota bacterium]